MVQQGLCIATVTHGWTIPMLGFLILYIYVNTIVQNLYLNTVATTHYRQSWLGNVIG